MQSGIRSETVISGSKISLALYGLDSQSCDQMLENIGRKTRISYKRNFLCYTLPNIELNDLPLKLYRKII